MCMGRDIRRVAQGHPAVGGVAHFFQTASHRWRQTRAARISAEDRPCTGHLAMTL
jgi:hypothetical protein